jgi:hypothetical protein
MDLDTGDKEQQDEGYGINGVIGLWRSGII